MLELQSALRGEVGVRETNRAECGLTTLSFQSVDFPNRHAWIDTDLGGNISVDLEDWSTDETWDNAVACFVACNIESASTVTARWLQGEDLESCRNTNGVRESSRPDYGTK
ncbi:hypothetical protein CEE69_00650 [Rhodopirellula bahusiensis]|uniref:Uncharacterized protein n=1 Tax=Rhodopirellula bahusiensis TaxID=2014065 RepID=A0A2G1WD20_9BACT|nr:hypothetical protein CEE69_00650 [Rhodopirellula bahusiensis]